MKSFIGFLLVFVSFIAYVILALQLGIHQRYPIVHYLIGAGGLFLLFKEIRTRFTWPRLALNVLSWMLFLLFGWWTQIYSTYRTPAPQAVQKENALPPAAIAQPSLKSTEGQATALASLFHHAPYSLLVFYRGHW